MNYSNLDKILKMDNNTTGIGEKLLKNLLKIHKNQQIIKSKLKKREEMILPIINTHKFLKNPEKLPQLLDHQIWSRKISKHKYQLWINHERSKTIISKYLDSSKSITQNQEPRPDLDSSDFSGFLVIFWEFFGVGKWELLSNPSANDPP